MSLSVRIEGYCHRSFPDQQAAPVVIPWLASYYEGLLSPYALETDLSLLESGRRNDFLSMARPVMDDIRSRHSLDDVGLFLMAHQTLDTYFPFRSTTTRLCREFDITAPAIGMTEQELTSPYIALLALLAAFRQKNFSGSGLLLVLDQATLPYHRPGAPEGCIDNALLIKLAPASASGGIGVQGKKYWIEENARKAGWIEQSIYAYLDARRIEMNDVHLVFESNMDSAVAAALPARSSIADARLMSASGLVAALELVEKGCKAVLLAHLSNEGHLYLFSFTNSAAALTNEEPACSI